MQLATLQMARNPVVLHHPIEDNNLSDVSLVDFLVDNSDEYLAHLPVTS